MTCLTENCNKPVSAKGLCKSCYDRKWRQDHKERVCERNRNYYFKDLEYSKEIRKQHKEHNRNTYNFYKAKHRVGKLNATPKWADLEKIKQFYENCPKGCQVDHIVPLNHELVCGLHTIENLQYLPEAENKLKNNKFDGTLDNNSWRNSSCQ